MQLYKVGLVCGAFIALISCSKNSQSNQIAFGSPGVYLAGGSYRAYIWKEGVALNLLPDTPAGNFSTAKGICVAGNDVYTLVYTWCACGGQGRRVYSSGLLYKNNAFAYQVPGAGTKMFALGSDLYICGSSNGQATYWKNGNPTIVGKATYSSNGTAVFVDGSDVYEAGYNQDTITTRTVSTNATYWKNGTAVKVGSANSQANAIYVSGGNVYLAGFDTDLPLSNGSTTYTVSLPVLWKNGVKTYLPLNIPANVTISSGSAQSVFVSGSDVYVIGNIEVVNSTNPSFVSGTHYYCWKNNVIDFYQPPNSAGTGNFSDLYVKGTDVYIAGGNGTTPGYWINKVFTALDGSDSYPSAIFVK